MFSKTQPTWLLAVIGIVVMTAATANAQVLIEHQGIRYIERSNIFEPLAQVVVGPADVRISGLGVFGQTSVDTNVKWVIFDSTVPKSPAFLSTAQSVFGVPGSYASNARWYDSPAIDFTLLANHRYAVGILADKLGSTGFRWGVTTTASMYGGGGPTISAHGLSVPFTAALANAGLAGSFYETPALYTFAAQSDPLQWTDAVQPSLRILSAVPEPPEWSMIVAGLLVIGIAARRRRRNSA